MKKVLMSFAAGFILVGASATSASAEEYHVEDGDTLSEIGQEYDVSVDNLKSWNDLESDLIIVDQTLEIDEDEAGEAAPQADQAESEENQSADEQEDANAEEAQQETDDTAVENESAEQEDEEAAEEQDNQKAPAEQENTDNQEGNNEDEQDGDNDADGETMTMSATAYTADCEGCSGTTADGTDLDGDEKVVAVDPDKIPLGSEVHVEGYGDAVAADTGGAINGDKIDLHVSDDEEANEFGVQDVEVTVK